MNSIFLIRSYFDEIIPAPRCELIFNKDYELLIAVMLSAQATDKRVNVVTDKLFNKYKTLEEFKFATYEDIEPLVRELGNYTKKTNAIIKIASKLINEYDGVVPNNREALEAFPMIGRKTASVVLSEIFDVPTIAVDTHVERVSKRLELANDDDNLLKIEENIKKLFNELEWNRINHQFVLFGRYICTAKRPKCNECKLKKICKYYNEKIS